MVDIARRILDKTFGVIGMAGLVLSAHGFYAWLHRDDWQLAADIIEGAVKQGDLFFSFTIPVVGEVISWMSYEGGNSIFMPIATAIGAVLLLRYRRSLTGVIL